MLLLFSTSTLQAAKIRAKKERSFEPQCLTKQAQTIYCGNTLFLGLISFSSQNGQCQALPLLLCLEVNSKIPMNHFFVL